ncbi:MAG: hypothetical protein L0Y58_12060, partial [Verrucomicrobia subdivision 3 bacterium]|nr:hypothetical protein [Limisphaerales bacterium]
MPDGWTTHSRHCFSNGSQREAIAAAARELDQLRTAWLNPPAWTRTEILEFPGSLDGPWARYVGSSRREEPAAEKTVPSRSASRA